MKHLTTSFQCQGISPSGRRWKSVDRRAITAGCLLASAHDLLVVANENAEA